VGDVTADPAEPTWWGWLAAARGGYSTMNRPRNERAWPITRKNDPVHGRAGLCPKSFTMEYRASASRASSPATLTYSGHPLGDET
jgi:hypothetical protein